MRAAASNTQKAVAELRRMIFEGQLGPGSDHLETELADRLGMSRTPIREAILVLSEQGLVRVRPRHGMRILAISPHDMRDVYDVLTVLECHAAERAAAKGYSEKDLLVLRRAIDHMDAALAGADREAWALADANFHRELLSLGGNRRVELLAALLEDQVRYAKAVTLHIRPLPVKSNEDHRAVLDAIAIGDAEEAGRRHRAHRRAARDMLVELLVGRKLKHS